MICEHCGDNGLIWLNWADYDGLKEFAVCLCDMGVAWRRTDNCGHPTVPLWHLWCARERIDPSRVVLMEDILTSEELAERGFSRPVASLSREAALLATGRKQKARR